MLLAGKIFKHKSHWLIEVPALDLMTQGRSRKEAFEMLRDALLTLMNRKGFEMEIYPGQGTDFLLNSNSPGLLALLLKRQRVKNRLSLEEMAKRLGCRSKNAYAQFEQGRSQPSLEKLQEFLQAMNPRSGLELNIIERPVGGGG